MKIAVPYDSGGSTVSVPKEDMLTWAGPNAMKVDTMYSAAWWAQRGFSNWIICGKGHDANHAACIPYTLSYTGTPTRLRVGLRILVTNSRVRTFRWALTTARADQLFRGKGPVSDQVAVAQGTFTPAYTKQTSWQTFDFWTGSIPASGYLYLWRTSNSYGNIHVEDATLQAFVATSQTVWRDATPYIYDNGWKQATPYIYDNGWQSGG